MPAGPVELKAMKLADIKPAEWNPRTISEEALAGLSASLNEFGLVQPLVWNKRTQTLVAGHQRLKALIDAGEKEALTAVVDLDPAREKALNVALNNPQITGEFSAEVKPLLETLETKLPELTQALKLLDVPAPIEFEEPPASIQENLDELKKLKERRKQGNENKQQKDDTEKFLIVVYPTRGAKELALRSLGLSPDERYVSSALVEVRAKRRDQLQNQSELPKSAPVKHAGATG